MKFLDTLFIIILFSACTSTKDKGSIEYPIQNCENINIIEHAIDKNPLRTEKLKNIDSLGYAYTYAMIFSKLDSLAEQNIRKRVELLTSKVIEHRIPDVSMISDKTKLVKSYPFMTSRFYQVKSNLVSKGTVEPSVLKALTSESDIRNQLIFRLYSNLSGNNTITAIIIDSKENELLYYDEISFNCDVRSEKTLFQAMNFLIDRIK